MSTKKKETEALGLLASVLREKQQTGGRSRLEYRVPGLWNSIEAGGEESTVDPYSYYFQIIDRIRGEKAYPRTRKPTGGEWTRGAVVYNMFIRTTAAYDHDADGKLEMPVNAEGFRETGSFLKAIAMLPYIRGLGADTVHLLPITSIGHDGNKGTLGSPYAIRNPYELDENLAEPALGLDAKTEFKAFVEAAQRMPTG
jgi:pullulanase/glycogen debranching enzyme